MDLEKRYENIVLNIGTGILLGKTIMLEAGIRFVSIPVFISESPLKYKEISIFPFEDIRKDPYGKILDYPNKTSATIENNIANIALTFNCIFMF